MSYPVLFPTRLLSRDPDPLPAERRARIFDELSVSPEPESASRNEPFPDFEACSLQFQLHDLDSLKSHQLALISVNSRATAVIKAEAEAKLRKRRKTTLEFMEEGRPEKRMELKWLRRETERLRAMAATEEGNGTTFTEEEVERRFVKPLRETNVALVIDLAEERRRLQEAQSQLLTLQQNYNVNNSKASKRVRLSSVPSLRELADLARDPLQARKAANQEAQALRQAAAAQDTPPGPEFSTLDSTNSAPCPPELLQLLHPVLISQLHHAISPYLLLSFLKRPNFKTQNVPRPVAISRGTMKDGVHDAPIILFAFKSAQAAQVAMGFFENKALRSPNHNAPLKLTRIQPGFQFRWDNLSDETKWSWTNHRQLPVEEWIEKDTAVRAKQSAYNHEKRRIKAGMNRAKKRRKRKEEHLLAQQQDQQQDQRQAQQQAPIPVHYAHPHHFHQPLQSSGIQPFHHRMDSSAGFPHQGQQPMQRAGYDPSYEQEEFDEDGEDYGEDYGDGGEGWDQGNEYDGYY